MLELEGRLIAASVVQALREQGATVQEITVAPNGAGLSIRAALDGPVVECHLPPGYFAPEQVAFALIQATGACYMETK